MTMMELDAAVEALLFFKGEPVSIREISRHTGQPEPEVQTALVTLQQRLSGRGLRLIIKDDEALLVTAPELAELIDRLQADESNRELGKAAVETLAIILYRGPVTRAEIEYIRGVNSAFILRSLLIRGLVERLPSPIDQRRFQYRPTFDLLSHLGISSIEEMPEFDTVRREIEIFERATHAREDQRDPHAHEENH